MSHTPQQSRTGWSGPTFGDSWHNNAMSGIISQITGNVRFFLTCSVVVSRMVDVHREHTEIDVATVMQRISVAVAHVPGVTLAAPPYNASRGARVGHGVTWDDRNCHRVVTCYVVFQPAKVRSVAEHCQLIQALVQLIVRRMTQHNATINIVVTDVSP